MEEKKDEGFVVLASEPANASTFTFHGFTDVDMGSLPVPADPTKEQRERFSALWKRISMKNFPFKPQYTMTVVGQHVDVRVTFPVINRVSGSPDIVGANFVIPHYYEDDQMFMYLRTMFQRIIIHELDECMQVDDKLYIDPHTPLENTPMHVMHRQLEALMSYEASGSQPRRGR